MNRHECSLEREELVAWREGTLDARRSAELAVHIDQCPLCQEQIETAEQVDELFEKSWPLVRDPDGERRTIAAIYGFRSSGWDGRTLAVALLIAFVLPLVATALLWPPPTGADAGVTGLVNVGREHVGRTVPDGSLLGGDELSGISNGRSTIAPDELPIGLTLDGREEADGSGAVLYYSNDELEIRLRQTPVESADGHISTDSPGYIVIDGVHVAYLEDPRPDAVASMIWERHGVQYSMMTLEAPDGPDGGLHLDDAVAIIRGLFNSQDAGGGEVE